MSKRLLYGLAAVAIMFTGLGLVWISARHPLIERPNLQDQVVLAAVFVVVALVAFRVISAITIRSTMTIPDFGRDLTWDGLAFAAALFSAYIASSIDLRIMPDMPQFKGLILAVTALFLVLLVMLCEGSMETMDHSNAATRTIPCTFGAISYIVAFLLTLSHISLPHR